MLVATGFSENLGHRLLQYVCFKPADFVLTEQVARGPDLLTCQLYFERKGDEYICSYYDASFLKEVKVPDLSIQGVNLKELDRRMGETDWQMNAGGSFDQDLDGPNWQAGAGEFKQGVDETGWQPGAGKIKQGVDRTDWEAGAAGSLHDEAGWQRENQIEGIATDLLRLAATDEGKPFADALKLKHWATVPLHPMMGSLNAIRSRFEVSQRFYFFDGKGISVEEAYRFLLNRWLEKKFQAGRKKALPGNDVVRNTDGEASGSDKGLLKKKRVKAQKIKRL